MTVTLKAEGRQSLTRSEVNLKRREGKVPAVVYGKKIEPTPLFIDQKELMALIKANRHAVIDMDVPGSGKQSVMLSDVHRDTMTRELLHVDFHQINMDEPVKTTVGLDFAGDAKGVREGGMLQVILHEVEIRCLPQQIPTSLEIDISGLELGDTFLVSSIQAPPGVEIKTDPELPVVTVLAPQKAADEEVKDAESAGGVKAEAPTTAEKVGGAV
jgi:large subunit ribosomal protein L25